MLPITLNLPLLKIALVGGGRSAKKRLKQLIGFGADELVVFAKECDEEFVSSAGERLIKKLPSQKDLQKFNIIMIADLEDNVAFKIAEQARKLGKLVNVEDRKEYCDFYYSAVVKRGDLILAVNTMGKSPALTVRIRKFLEQLFPPVWESRLNFLGESRDKWREKNLSADEIINRTNQFVDKEGWFKEFDNLASKNDNSKGLLKWLKRK